MTAETTSGRGGSGVREETREVAGTMQERAGDVAQTAREQAGDVAQTARDQAGDVVAHTQAEVRDLIQELRTSLRQQTQAQRDRMAEVLGGFERELQQMVDQGGGTGPATEAVRQVTQRLRSWRQYLEGEVDVAADLRSFARRRPGTFLLAAAAVGVVAGRITRGATAHDGQVSGAGSTGGYGSAGHGATGVGHGTPGYGVTGDETGEETSEYAEAEGPSAAAYPSPATPDYPAAGEGYAEPAPGSSQQGPSSKQGSAGQGPTRRRSTGHGSTGEPYGGIGQGGA